MNKSTLFLWLKTLSPGEIEGFRYYLCSPQHKRKKLPLRLLDYLAPFLEASAGEGQPREEEALALLYPGKEFTPQRLRRVMMELHQIMEEFLVIHARPLMQPALERELRIMRFLLDREQHHLFLERLTDFDKTLEAMQYSTERELAYMHAEQMRNEYIIHNLLPEDTFEKVDQALDRYYLSRKLETWSSMLTREKRHAQRHTYSLRPLVESMVTSAEAGEWPLVKVWWLVYRMESEDEKENYNQLVSMLTVFRDRFPHYVMRQIHGYMFNFLNRTQAPGREEYYTESWRLLSSMLAEGTMHLEGRISQPFFLTTVRVACLSGQVMWADAFIREQAGSLAVAGSEELLGFCKALVLYYSGKSAEAWKASLSLKTHEPRLEIAVRILQMQIAYDTDKEEEFFRYSEAFRRYLERKPNLGERLVHSCFEFQRICDRMGRAYFTGKKLPQSLVQEIQHPGHEVNELLWLKQRLGRL